MFEDSLLPFGNTLDRRRKRWIAASSLVAQAAILTACLAAPMMTPAVMPIISARVRPVSLLPPRLKVEPVRPAPSTSTSSAALRAPATAVALASRPLIFRPAPSGPDQPPPLQDGIGMSNVGSSLGDLTSTRGSGTGTGPIVTVKRPPAADASVVRLSSGVTRGMLLTPLRPQYPRIAKAAGVHGVVVLTAVIDRTGRITGLQVLSGPMMLRTAALESVRDARYQPYLLDGAPVEVETTISVNFTISGG